MGSQQPDEYRRRHDNDNDNDKDYIVMLPYMAHGHLIPFLALGSQILRRAAGTLSVVIATTKLNIHYLRSSSTSSDGIIFAELPFRSSDHGLPPDRENTENLPPTQIADFLHASLSLEAPCRAFLRSAAAARGGRPPLCLVSDVFLGWASRVAADAGTVNVTFSTGGAYGTAAYVSLWHNLPHRSTESEDFAVPGFPERYRFSRSQLHRYLRFADGTDAWSRFFRPQISMSMESHAWLCCTVEEFEPLGLEILRNYLKTPVWPVGPLLPEAALNRNDSSTSSSSSLASISRQRVGKEYGVSAEHCIEWLDSQSPKSVLYVSFGSQNTIGAPEMMELAIGLEKSEKPFVWVIRPPLGFDPKEEFRSEWLPEDFEERMNEKKRGLLVRNWAPQLDILTHQSTGAFLSHCGWNSVAEALSQGVTLIGWPLAAEQAYNVKMLAEEKGVCVELARGGAGTGVVAKEVTAAVEAAMGDKEMRRKAEDIREQMRAAVREGGSALRAMDEFLASVVAKREETYRSR